jgi:hypothetical protein
VFATVEPATGVLMPIPGTVGVKLNPVIGLDYSF